MIEKNWKEIIKPSKLEVKEEIKEQEERNIIINVTRTVSMDINFV